MAATITEVSLIDHGKLVKSGATSVLDDIYDVAVSNPSNGQILSYSNTSHKWENTTPTLNGNTDVAISSPSDGQILKYDSTTQKWKNVTEATPTLNDNTDVNITSQSNGQILKYDSTSQKWKNTTPTLNDNTNVNISSPANGQLLKYNSTSQKWENYTEPIYWSSAVSCVIGDTSCTITNSNITINSVVDIYSQNASGIPISISSVVVTSGQAVVSFDALTVATSFKAHIFN